MVRNILIIGVLPFLTFFAEEGIFLDFPVATRRIIGKEVTEVLLKNQISYALINLQIFILLLTRVSGLHRYAVLLMFE